MRPIGRIFITVALAALASCNASGDQAGNGQAQGGAAQSDADKLRAMPAPDLLKLAFRTAFKADDNASLAVGDETFSFRPQSLSWIGDRAVLISAGRGDDCHACAGTLAIHYLQPIDGGFTVAGAWPKATMGASFGAPPSWALRTDIAANPVIQAEGGGTFQGYSCAVGQLVELTPNGPVTIADGLTLGYSNAGAAIDGTPVRAFQAKIVAGEKDQNFTLVYQGAERATVTYRHEGATYVRAAGSPDIPGC
ncbi:MAG: hypothetical protein ABS87_12955 [Sphingomonas sp. SCN 67-18]|uniref:hypothetical protein n=1 Tax=uncultured Sphingomonas sp. TaxID=158754 RepID=UPI00086971C1|nr:hypothetical protein [Sphingomonas sp. SCN 67-18]ODU19808.1 MAG: hypothetical protein ABS87_12955 [Sphingomonas sp. SCN 67-18]